MRVGARIRARSTLISLDRVGDDAVQVVSRVTIEVEGSPKPACVADVVSRYYFDVPAPGGDATARSVARS